MTRGIYYVESYDGKIRKIFRNYKSAENYCRKLIQNDINCGIFQWDWEKDREVMIIGC